MCPITRTESKRGHDKTKKKDAKNIDLHYYKILLYLKLIKVQLN